MTDNYEVTDYYATEPNYDKYEPLCRKDLNRSFRSQFIPAIYSIICFLALKGNFLVILTYVHFNHIKTMTDIFLLNLAVADLFFALSLPFWAVSILIKWPWFTHQKALCKAMYGIYKITFFSGMLLLTCISIDRYFSITKAVSAHRYRNNAAYYGCVASLVTWSLAVLFSLPEIIYLKVNSNTCVASSYEIENMRVPLMISQIVFGFIIPALVMLFCYSCIIKTLMQARNIERNKALKVIFAVVAMFVISQLPYNVVMGLSTHNNTSCDFDNNLLFAMDVTQGIAFLRCCVNPFLYAFIGVKFRTDLLKLMKTLGCRNHNPILYFGKLRSSAGLSTGTTSFSP